MGRDFVIDPFFYGVLGSPQSGLVHIASLCAFVSFEYKFSSEHKSTEFHMANYWRKWL